MEMLLAQIRFHVIHTEMVSRGARVTICMARRFARANVPWISKRSPRVYKFNGDDDDYDDDDDDCEDVDDDGGDDSDDDDDGEGGAAGAAIAVPESRALRQGPGKQAFPTLFSVQCVGLGVFSATHHLFLKHFPDFPKAN